MKKILALVCCLSMLCGVMPVYAEETTETTPIQLDEPMTEPNRGIGIKLEEAVSLEEGAPVENSIPVESMSVMEEGAIELIEERTRDLWRITNDVFVGTGNLTDSNPQDMYLVTLTSTDFSALNISCSDPSVLVQLFIEDPNKPGSYQPTDFATKGGAVATNIGAGNYLLVVGSAGNVGRGSYTLMWNHANPSSTGVLYNTPDLSRIITYQSHSKIYSNGVDILANLKWEDHKTNYITSGYIARDMILDRVNPSQTQAYVGYYKSDMYEVKDKSALIIELLPDAASWYYTQSVYVNQAGDVTHTISDYDLYGKKTPRRLDAEDISYSGHYIIIDMEKNVVTDFASKLNWYYNGGGYEVKDIIPRYQL